MLESIRSNELIAFYALPKGFLWGFLSNKTRKLVDQLCLLTVKAFFNQPIYSLFFNMSKFMMPLIDSKFSTIARKEKEETESSKSNITKASDK